MKKTAIVTGATGAIGSAIAQLLVEAGYRVVMAVRSKSKAERVINGIRGDIRYELVDVSQKSSVQAFAGKWNGPLHVLVNNAAICPRKRSESPDGIELQFATNVLGYCWMIDAFTPFLEKSSPSRVVNVASYWAGGLDLSDLEFKNRRYDNNDAYRQSKQANRMLTRAYAELLADKEITVNACHPGDVNSTLSNALGFGGHEAPEEGAATPVWVATSSAGGEESGKYFERGVKSTCRFMEDGGAVEELYRVCQGY